MSKRLLEICLYLIQLTEKKPGAIEMGLLINLEALGWHDKPGSREVGILSNIGQTEGKDLGFSHLGSTKTGYQGRAY